MKTVEELDRISLMVDEIADQMLFNLKSESKETIISELKEGIAKITTPEVHSHRQCDDALFKLKSLALVAIKVAEGKR